MKKVFIRIEVNTPNTQSIKNFNTAFEAVEFLLTHFTPEERQKLFGEEPRKDLCKCCGKPMKAHGEPNYLCMNPYCDNYIKINK